MSSERSSRPRMPPSVLPPLSRGPALYPRGSLVFVSLEQKPLSLQRGCDWRGEEPRTEPRCHRLLTSNLHQRQPSSSVAWVLHLPSPPQRREFRGLGSSVFWSFGLNAAQNHSSHL
ncbi:hypothetical protein UPYG_G00240300 [Umbra pygmaea]|uniref:Uncharacterized protein n=1 Tax=Umbra pygmaea TaxID=75934 RepID=A0ABD0X302_UMBPY